MLILNKNILTIGGNRLEGGHLTPPEPPGPGPLPPVPINTVRVRTSDGNVPVKATNTSYETATLVSGTTDIYDVYKSGDSFYNLLYQSTNVIEVLDVNTTGIINMSWTFSHCTSLTSVPLFDTSNVTNMDHMFYGCTALKSVPLFNTSNVTDMSSAFNGCTSLKSVPLFDTSKVRFMSRMLYNCTNVESGALALYQQASSQVTPPSNHNKTFNNCGSNTTTGAAELAQIPSDWK